MTAPTPVVIDYTNHRGERRPRAVIPQTIYFGNSRWHEGFHWFLTAHDIAKKQQRTFKLTDIAGIENLPMPAHMAEELSAAKSEPENIVAASAVLKGTAR